MILTGIWGPCPECGGDSAWTTAEVGKGVTDPVVDCECQERTVRPTDRTE